MKMMFFLITPLCLAGLALAGPEEEGAYLGKIRQLTFEGKRAGEGYFSADNRLLVFQSEREPENPFYQIYLMDMETGDVRLVSPGHGKTTCSWVHPDNRRVLFASTHLDPLARAKQKEELELRASGKRRRYSWDYDEYFDLFSADLKNGGYARLTHSRGYDAEGSFSPDGKWIAFASNRHAYTETLSAEEQKIFANDKSYMMEIYIMPATGGEAVRLTSVNGYDGGPFFDAAGKRICWRRFAPDGVTAEILTMGLDGTDQRQLTHLQAMSWAPYFHPSGDYLIFATNLHGFGNFELYLVDDEGEKQPVRVTFTDGFDGLPVFTPDGKGLAWTSNRSSNRSSQIFMAQWDDAAARKALGLDRGDASGVDLSATRAAVAADDLRRHVAFLASEETEGRLTGTEGERKATAYVASVFRDLGLAPAGEDGTYFQQFPFIAGVSLGPDNDLRLDGRAYKVDLDWRPLAFTKTGPVEEAEVVFAGYGLQAPASDGFNEYDSYTHLDVKDRWVLVLRYLPERIGDDSRRHFNRYSGLRYKAMIVREQGARGLLVASGPNSRVKNELVKLAFDASLSGTSLPAISISNRLARDLVASAGKNLEEIQSSLDSGEPAMGFALPVKLSVKVDIVQEKRLGRNVVGRIRAGEGSAKSAVIVGAHVDHLGRGEGSGSLAKEDEHGQIHHGADDNASGVASILEMAQFLMDRKKSGRLLMKHDLIFAAWSGEELGLLGSNYYVNHFDGESQPDSLRPAVVAYLNLDMVGRLEKSLVLQGLGSSPYWAGEVERRNVPIGLPIVTRKDSYLPTDATSFYLKGVPILSAFTGSHADYHSPRDTPDKLNYQGMKDVARFMALVAHGLVQREAAPEYSEMEKPEGAGARAVMRAYLGTIPDYAQGDISGVKLSGVSKGGPAAKAGLRGGDIIVWLAGRKVENIYDYTYAIEAIKIGEPTKIMVMRGGERVELTVIPGSRE